ncbi:MarR family winged helix-turn-helix transcriptional regulator [Microbacterium sp.]|uniref:MarR family winged helix-turn-helix transcriptional regulator n=1 Tax=Microbacterium sp. TaxID=51671 RepID=UPI0039E2A963
MNLDDSERRLVSQLGAVARMSERALLDRFAQAGYPELRRRHAALFQALADGGVRAKDLAVRLGMTPQAIAQLIDDLEGSGDVTRMPDRTDGRARLVVLTERGRRALHVCDTILDDMAREAAESIGRRRLREMQEVLDDLAAHFGPRR